MNVELHKIYVRHGYRSYAPNEICIGLYPDNDYYPDSDYYFVLSDNAATRSEFKIPILNTRVCGKIIAYLPDDVTEWLAEMSISYKTECHTLNWYLFLIHFENEKDQALFKLRWV